MTALAALFLLLPTSAGAAPVDFSRLPGTFCTPVLDVAEQTTDCPANSTFTKAASSCLDSLNQLETSLGAKAAAIAATGTKSQQGENSAGHSEYGFSSEALTYLLGVAGVAKLQLESYHAYVVPPSSEYDPQEPEENGEALGWAWGVGCFRDTHSRLEAEIAELSSKIQRYTARLSETRAFKAKLGARNSNYGSIAGKAAKGRDTQKAPTPEAGDSSQSPSDITGLKQEKKSEETAPPAP